MKTCTIEELARTIQAEAGIDITPRTIRYYIAEGVLRRPDKRGEFSQAHFDRLRLILQLKQAFLPISEIREKLELLSDSDVTAELERYETRGKPPAPNLAAEYTQRLLAWRNQPDDEAKPLPLLSTPLPGAKTETWERITLTPHIEIHVRQPLSKEEQTLLDALLDLARKPGKF